MNSKRKHIEIDLLTLISVSIVAWSLTNILHEIVGHAGSAALLGIPVRAVSTTTMYLDGAQAVTVVENRIIHAAGSVMNLLTGIVALLFLRSPKITHSAIRYFLWLFSTVSFIIVTLNLISTPLIGAGDWTIFIQGFERKQLWLSMIIGVGVVLAIPGYILPLHFWMPNLRENKKLRLKITVIPVITMIAVQTLSLISSPFSRLPPEQNHLLASVFLFLHFILWAILVNIIPMPHSRNPIESIRLPRSKLFLGLGLVMAFIFIAVLGPGLGPLEEDPRLGTWNWLPHTRCI